MREILKYIDEKGVEIIIKKETFEYSPKNLSETYSENGKKIYTKQYENGRLSNISFYAYSNEELQTILKEKNGDTSITFIHYKNSYKITEYLAYKENILIGNMITVYDKDENCICFKKYEMKGSELICTITDKSYFDKGEKKYEFIYNEDGTCFMIDSVQTYQEDIFAWDIGTSHTDFTWDGFEYYKNTEPLIPEI